MSAIPPNIMHMQVQVLYGPHEEKDTPYASLDDPNLELGPIYMVNLQYPFPKHATAC